MGRSVYMALMCIGESTHNACCADVSSDGNISDPRFGLALLTCTGSPPTTPSQHRPAARSSSSPRSARQRRRAWPARSAPVGPQDTSPTHLGARVVMAVGEGVRPPVERAAGREGLELDVVLVVLPLALARGAVGHSAAVGVSGCKRSEVWTVTACEISRGAIGDSTR